MSAPVDWADAGPRRWPNAVFALRSEPRVSWCMHVPSGFAKDPAGHTLVVAVHGTGRSAQAYRDAFAAYAEENRWVVLAPLFPVGVRGDGNADGYKQLVEGQLRYDLLLLDMVKELGEVLRTDFQRFQLFGFSGGGHFAHRFLYLHPNRLEAVSVGAPGGITRIDDTRDWWLGTRNLHQLFGRALDLEAIRRVRIQLLVGGEDSAPLPVPAHLLAQLGDLKPNRLAFNGALYANYLRHDLNVVRSIVPGAAHEGLKLVGEAAGFFGGYNTNYPV